MSKVSILLTTNILQKDYGEPVGILFLAAYLRNKGYSVDIYDPQINGDSDLRVLSSVCSSKVYDFVGISVLTSADESLMIVDSMAKVIKEKLPNAIIGCGGVGASLRYKEFVQIGNIDLVMLGEGENTITEVVNCIEFGCVDGFENIAGVATKDHLNFIKRDLINNLDEIPFMARDTLDERVKELGKEYVKQFEVRIFCGRGCFGTCTFCANFSVANLCNGYRCRQRSVESLFLEMEELHKKYGVIRFSFWDDNFLPIGEEGLRKAKKIYDLFSKLSFRPVFGIQTRADTLTDEIVSMLQKAGMQNVYLGVENINKEELRILGKQIKPEQIKSALDILYKYGYSYNSEADYRIRIGYIAFTPYTTVKAIKDNYNFIMQYHIPINKLNKKLLAFHDTPIRKRMDRDGFLDADFSWKFNKKGVEQLYHAILDITERYSEYYDKVRYISKVCKFNFHSLDWNKVNDIKERLLEIAGEYVGMVCDLACDDYTKVEGMDDLIQEALAKIDYIAKESGIIKWYDDFINSNADYIDKFEKATYVFFD